MTVRVDNPAPAAYDLGQIRALAATRFGPALLDCNEVAAGNGTVIAVYLPYTPNGAKAAAWTNDLATYTVSHPTADEIAANQATLRDKASQALTANATYLALTSPTNAQNTAQVKALTRQVNVLIRLAVTQDFSDLTGT